MRALRRASRNAAALILLLVVLSCRRTDGPTGIGRTAPGLASFAVQPVLGASAGEPVIPLRRAHIRLFRIPGQIPEMAVVDTIVPFLETDDDRAVTLGVILTMANERFRMELALIDDHGDVVYIGRDTVIAYTNGVPPAARPLALRYAGPDTAVVRIALAPRDTLLAIGDALPLRLSAIGRDGRETGARLGFLARGSDAVTVGPSGVLFARSPAAARSTWIVARTITGVVDSVSVGAIVPARSISLTPGSGRVIVGKSIGLAAVAQDSTGAPIAGRTLQWRSSDSRVATVSDGRVTGVGVGSAQITAASERASAVAQVTVLPAGVARVLPSVAQLVLDAGDQATVSAAAEDALGDPVAVANAQWSTGHGAIASITPDGRGGAFPATVQGIAPGATTLAVTIDGVTATIDVQVQRSPAVSVTIAPRSLDIRVGDAIRLTAVARDARGNVVPASEISWRSLQPTVASVDGNGGVRGLQDNRAQIVASIDAVADTIRVDVRP